MNAWSELQQLGEQNALASCLSESSLKARFLDLPGPAISCPALALVLGQAFRLVASL